MCDVRHPRAVAVRGASIGDRGVGRIVHGDRYRVDAHAAGASDGIGDQVCTRTGDGGVKYTMAHPFAAPSTFGRGTDKGDGCVVRTQGGNAGDVHRWWGDDHDRFRMAGHTGSIGDGLGHCIGSGLRGTYVDHTCAGIDGQVDGVVRGEGSECHVRGSATSIGAERSGWIAERRVHRNIHANQ